jgi:RNase P/RNase MRP subunit p29
LLGIKTKLGGLKDGEGISARFKGISGLTVDRASNVVVADYLSHAIRKVTKAGAVVSTLAGNGEKGFADGQGAEARFNCPHSVVVAANGDLIVSDLLNHCLRVVTPEPDGLAMDPEGNVLVADFLNHSVRKVTMTGAVSTGK